MSDVLTALRVLSTITAIIAALSPAPDFWRIYKNRSTGTVSILPVVTMFCNCYMWIMYAHLVNNFLPQFVICTVGMFTSVAFGAFYYHWSNDHRHIHQIYNVAFKVLAVYTLYYALGTSGVTNQSNDHVETTLGILSSVVNLALDASPLETMKEVVQTKDASTIPIILSTSFLVNAAVWVAYAIADNNIFLLVPNAIGMILCTIQVTLYLMYRPKQTSTHMNDKEEVQVVDFRQRPGTRGLYASVDHVDSMDNEHNNNSTDVLPFL
ncbi:hypothetical protein BBO99_00007964 [Phytophthora kernoviae]|uniref:Sugar transporter SWEET1 n=2 Tax=Phytophthora kernoviae TaxID=325452 RepID=A0A3R7J3Y5_9STRA|nr:hypothetical protein G195_008451 [Phytophthora kernoviae 00238/432]KAG2516820.1 hypothetical protein JM16_007553 [Phytophthora kernoviae]KAG2519816.1 hypothetical protein JM18_007077 [Phytophthora kernoviae]RLN32501.1 hypothetical protein BBI17_007777 [Phytophthora kernoviae]RLN75912.1 hypothetical protein BBO99_00007964 [Phytophthora kernoviae]